MTKLEKQLIIEMTKQVQSIEVRINNLTKTLKIIAKK